MSTRDPLCERIAHAAIKYMEGKRLGVNSKAKRQLWADYLTACEEYDKTKESK